MARKLKLSRINPENIDSHDAYNRAQIRRQDVLKSREDPQVGPLEDRKTALTKKAQS